MPCVPHRRYTRFILSTIALTLLLIGVTNLVVNPWRVLPTFLSSKSLEPWRDFPRHTRTGKAGVVLTHPDTQLAMFGSSRVAIAMRSNDPAWQGLPALNVGVPCGNIIENTTVAHYSLDRLPETDWLILNLDYGTFMSDGDSRALADFYESPFSPSPPLERNLRYLVGTSTLIGSIDTLKRAAEGETSQFSPRGDWLTWHIDEPRQLLAQHLRDRKKGRDQQYGNHPEALREARKACFVALLDRCLSQGIRVTLTCIPMQALTQAWLGEDPAPGPVWETERRYFASVVDAMRLKYPDQQLDWWDFSLFHPLTTEPFPPVGKHLGGTDHWIDHSHPNSLLGAIMAARIAGTQGPEHAGPPFGWHVDGSNIDAFLADLVRTEAEYRQQMPQEIEWARKVTQTSTRP
ncbi:hypothetical protein HNR46_002890 [Haloferula luteola]|uniref:Uncharacterized protein n=1 Tax=Haloferula luteola TaxID=595692 RepID=A0A840V3T5_9BACT|nr:hypothetical protein [Haloferula luteola]MBB5352642.1 hypothetical protein [Haloferula luteola]